LPNDRYSSEADECRGRGSAQSSAKNGDPPGARPGQRIGQPTAATARMIVPVRARALPTVPVSDEVICPRSPSTGPVCDSTMSKPSWPMSGLLKRKTARV
jgi:hypothetical protein